MRLEVTRKSELAVRALVVLRSTPDRVKAPVLAEALGTTAAFVPQVVAPLVKAGWVQSDPGPLGGYQCVVDLDAVSVLDVIEAVDGETDGGQCVVADRPCTAQTPCVLHEAWKRARHELTTTLASMSLADLMLVSAS